MEIKVSEITEIKVNNFDSRLPNPSLLGLRSGVEMSSSHHWC